MQGACKSHGVEEQVTHPFVLLRKGNEGLYGPCVLCLIPSHIKKSGDAII
jgi:hypothetical protein